MHRVYLLSVPTALLCRPRQVVACLASTDHGIRIAAAELVRALAKDVFCSKSIVFPEALTNDDGKETFL